MHSKHLRQTAHHTMSTTYRNHHTTHPPPLPPSTTNHPWAESQAALIHSLRDISNPPCKKPSADILDCDNSLQIHARWTDPGLVEALSHLHLSLPPQTTLALKYGGRDVTAATWVTVHELSSSSSTSSPSSSTSSPPPVLRYVLWFHEYDDLDVEVGELEGREWGVGVGLEVKEEVKEEDGGHGGVKVKMEEEDVRDGVVQVKVEEEQL